MAELKRTQEVNRTLKVHLNGKLEMSSNGVDYNLRGTVVPRNFVEHVEHVRQRDIHILTLSKDAYASSKVAVAQNGGEKCVQIYADYPNRSILIPAKLVEKIERIETTRVTLVP